jgi:hypothetical protein
MPRTARVGADTVATAGRTAFSGKTDNSEAYPRGKPAASK